MQAGNEGSTESDRAAARWYRVDTFVKLTAVEPPRACGSGFPALERGQALLREVEHALDRHARAAPDLRIHEDLVARRPFERVEEVVQAVHRHPRAMGAA